MNIRDLRVGNLILFAEDSTIFEVTEISEYGVNVKNEEEETYIEIDSFEGIGITEDWLIKFGFKSVAGNYEFNNGTTNIVFYKNEIYESIEGQWKWYPHIRHIHQLQNLYFALTGEELELS